MPELKPNQLYRCDLLPGHWVATDAHGQPWMFPVIPNGWQRRKRYRGHLTVMVQTPAALVEVDAINAIGTGWPHSGKGDV